MIPLVRSMIHALLWDAMAVRRWMRGFAMWAGAVLMQVVSAGFDVVRGWSLREWAGRIGVAAVLGIGGLISVGEKNPTESK